MPKLTETFAKKLPQTKVGTEKYWDSEIKGMVLFVGKRSKTWYFQKDVGGYTKRILIGRFPIISAKAARQTALGFALAMGRGAGKVAQIGAPTLEFAMEEYLARPKLRSADYKSSTRRQLNLHLRDWMNLPLDEITKTMSVRRHHQMAKTPSAANHVFRSFRTIYNHARRTHDLAECPTMAIEWFAEEPNGRVIEDLKEWRQTIDDLPNPIHRVFYEFLLFTGLRKSEEICPKVGDGCHQAAV